MTSIQTLNPPSLPKPGGHYSHATMCGDLIFISGQLPVSKEGPLSRASFDDQARLALANLFEVLEAAGGSKETLLKVNVYLVGVDHWAAFNAVYADVMGAARPARAVIPVPDLHFGCLVEVDAVAARNAS